MVGKWPKQGITDAAIDSEENLHRTETDRSN